MKEILNKLIDMSGLTPYMVAKKTGIESANLYRYNSGSKPIGFTTLKKIANSIGYDLEIIIKKLPVLIIFISLHAFSQDSIQIQYNTNPPPGLQYQPESVYEPKSDTLCLTPTQYKNIYTGLKTGEQYRLRYEQAYNAAQDLNTIVQKQNDSLQVIYSRLTVLNTELNQAHADLTVESVKIERDKPVKWWKHPITWGIIGFIAGVLTVK